MRCAGPAEATMMNFLRVGMRKMSRVIEREGTESGRSGHAGFELLVRSGVSSAERGKPNEIKPHLRITLSHRERRLAILSLVTLVGALCALHPITASASFSLSSPTLDEETHLILLHRTTPLPRLLKRVEAHSFHSLNSEPTSADCDGGCGDGTEGAGESGGSGSGSGRRDGGGPGGGGRVGVALVDERGSAGESRRRGEETHRDRRGRGRDNERVAGAGDCHLARQSRGRRRGRQALRVVLVLEFAREAGGACAASQQA